MLSKGGNSGKFLVETILSDKNICADGFAVVIQLRKFQTGFFIGKNGFICINSGGFIQPLSDGKVHKSYISPISFFYIYRNPEESITIQAKNSLNPF